MTQISWTEAALVDIQRHYETLALISADVALRAIQAIRKAGDRR
jgi:plasmid stabilization system protein ParE